MSKAVQLDETRLLRLEEVLARTGVSRSTVYNWLDPKSHLYDASFPPKRKIGARSIGFSASEVEQWLAVRAGIPVPDNHLTPVTVASTAKHLDPLLSTDMSESSLALDANQSNVEDSQISIVRNLLEKRAGSGMIVSYKIVMEAVRLWADLESDRHRFEQILEKVSRAAHGEGKGLLSALVHDFRDGRSLPSEAFFSMAKDLGYRWDDPVVFVDRQIRALFELREDKDPAGINRKLVWVRTNRQLMLMRV